MTQSILVQLYRFDFQRMSNIRKLLTDLRWSLLLVFMVMYLQYACMDEQTKHNHNKECWIQWYNFFYDRKHKFGLNLQLICNHLRWFIFLDMSCTALASDFLALSLFNTFRKLNKGSLLAKGLCIFGDCAYADSLTFTQWTKYSHNKGSSI